MQISPPHPPAHDEEPEAPLSHENFAPSDRSRVDIGFTQDYLVRVSIAQNPGDRVSRGVRAGGGFQAVDPCGCNDVSTYPSTCVRFDPVPANIQQNQRENPISNKFFDPPSKSLFSQLIIERQNQIPFYRKYNEIFITKTNEMR